MSEEIKKRVSKVFLLGEFPKGTRKRGWGLIHDQIWFYDSPAWDDGRATPNLPPMQDHHRWWRTDESGAWMRLYMDRRMLWLPRWVTRLRVGRWRLFNRFRIHHFFSGDDDSASHDHPWDFVTFPLSTYAETVEQTHERSARRVLSLVRRFRFHYRHATHRHFVHEPPCPFRTFVMAAEVEPRRVWGFWPEPDVFVPFNEWTKYE